MVPQFGFRKWKGNVTERPIEERSDIAKELYADLSVVKPRQGISALFFFLIHVSLSEHQYR